MPFADRLRGVRLLALLFGAHVSDDLRGRRPGESLRANPYRSSAHDKGADGEEYVGLVLATLPGDRWTVLHSVPVDGIGDIDHLVIGPPGVVVINTKNHVGQRVRIDGDSISVGARDVDYARTARRHQRVAAQALVGAGAPVVPLHTMVAFVLDSASSLTVNAEPSGVGVCWAEDLPARLEAMPPAVSPDVARALATVASRPSTWSGGSSLTARLSGPGYRPVRAGAARRARRGADATRYGSQRRTSRGGRALAGIAGGVALLFALPFLASSVPWERPANVIVPTAPSAPSATETPRTSPTTPATRPSLPETPDFAYELFSHDPLTRYLEASLARGVDPIAVEPWIQLGTTHGDLDEAVAEVSVRSPYVYVDGWELRSTGLVPHYRLEPFATSTQQIRAALGIAEAAREIRAMDLRNARETVTAIHDWLADTATYDEQLAVLYSAGSLAPADDAQDAASAFRPFGTIGLGYARAFAAIAKELGLEAAVVTGEFDGMRHAWNTVHIDGERLLVDVALDDAGSDQGSDRWLLLAPADAAAMGYLADALPRP